MPSTSRNQRVAAAIAEHKPEQLYKRNRGMLSMSKEQLHDYARKPDILNRKRGIKHALKRSRDDMEY